MQRAGGLAGDAVADGDRDVAACGVVSVVGEAEECFEGGGAADGACFVVSGVGRVSMYASGLVSSCSLSCIAEDV